MQPLGPPLPLRPPPNASWKTRRITAPYVSPSVHGAHAWPYVGAMPRSEVSAASIAARVDCDRRLGVALTDGDGDVDRPALGDTERLRAVDRVGDGDGDRDTERVGDMDAEGVIDWLGVFEPEKKIAVTLGCGACAELSAWHGVQLAGRTSISTRPSAPGWPAPLPAFSGENASVPVTASAVCGQSSADGLELPPPPTD